MNFKIYFLAFISIVILLVSCNDNKDMEKQDLLPTDELVNYQEKVIELSENGNEPDSTVLEYILQNPELYRFIDSNSELWTEGSEENLKSVYSGSLTALGYDVKELIKTTKAMFYNGLSCDSRIQPRVTYLVKKYRYKKLIQIPAGASLILPPSNIMSTIHPMGIKPGTSSTVGYTIEDVSTGSTYDTYYLVSEGSEITHNLLGQQIASVSNPVIIPCNIGVPRSFLFKYQYSTVEW